MNYKLQEAKEQIELQVNQSEFKMKEVTKKLEMARKNLERAEEKSEGFANLVYRREQFPCERVRSTKRLVDGEFGTELIRRLRLDCVRFIWRELMERWNFLDL